MRAIQRSFTLLGWAVAFATCVSGSPKRYEPPDVIHSIAQRAKADLIDLGAVPGLDLSSTLESIASTYADAVTSKLSARAVSNLTGLIDVHAHCVPDWYRAIVPRTGGNPTPSWNVTGHLDFMASQSISQAVLAFSAPGANVYPGDQAATIALARLINEQSAAFARAYPDKFTFYAVVPLPYTPNAIAEATYALDTLGAAGIALYSNFEGRYLGDSAFKPFFEAMNARGSSQIIYVHPTTPYIRVNGTLIEANPTVYPTGNIEFYFETARLLAYDISTTNLFFGTDFPYAPIFTYGPSLIGIQTSPFVTNAERSGIFAQNARRLFGERIPL
ncbi:hypothetical protein GGP41_006398 [Bipolaris sorokiniana]|uniref:Amidohydrolase-related domain-containing protein n=1 Tax=Cochliobolus sativus TaxID=45130 RepID=A0A8H5ZIH9_COCSA|nr:hypothetical protein GGP41_006398 [Bipolaris sorokiniana]